MEELQRQELLPYATVAELSLFLRTSGSTLCLSEAVTRAIKLWIATQLNPATPEGGYQWKNLFLPSGTRVRMYHAGQWYYANVVDDELIFRGLPSSPRQMTIAVAGAGRDAWLDLWVRR